MGLHERADGRSEPGEWPAAAPRASTIVAAAAFGLVLLMLAASAVSGVRLTLQVTRAETAAYEPLSRSARRVAFVDRMGLPSGLFLWYAEQLRRGDRYYLHGAPGGFGKFADLRTTVRAVGRLLFLPAVETDDAGTANVIVTWQADPNELRLPYSDIVQAGEQPHHVARIAR